MTTEEINKAVEELGGRLRFAGLTGMPADVDRVIIDFVRHLNGGALPEWWHAEDYGGTDKAKP